jgi:hypothetical protein
MEVNVTTIKMIKRQKAAIHDPSAARLSACIVH